MGKPDEKKQQKVSSRRITLMMAGTVGALSVLVLQLWHLQVVNYEEYAAKSDRNRLRHEWLRSRRGLIYGQDESVVLADSRASWDLVLVPNDCTSPEEVCALLGSLVEVDGEALLAEIVRATEKLKEPFKTIVVKRDISKSEMAQVEEYSYALPGVYTNIRQVRRYPYGKTAGQLVGYIGEIDRDELDRLEPAYKQGDYVGKAGIERAFEGDLRGKDGQICVSVAVSGKPMIRTDAFGNPYVELDQKGRRAETEFLINPEAGTSMHLTLDMELQMEAERLLEEAEVVGIGPGATGAIVVLRADTGAVLAMASTPRYDPNAFVTRGRSEERVELLEDSSLPMLNRCYQKAYPPGSVFKIMLAIAALEEDVLTPHTSHSCGGLFRLPGVKRPWRCWRLKYGGHGRVDVVDSIAFSCDVFFYNVGRDLGIDKIKEWCQALGLGEYTGIDIPGEDPGLIPSREWKEEVRRKTHPDDPWEWKWYPGETINLSIGQGQAGTTPLQNAVMMAAVVNGGRRIYPHLSPASQREPSEPFISEETLRLVQEGMKKCVEKTTFPSGTGTKAQVPGLIVIGKTGTAQAVSRKHYTKYEDEADIPYALRDHAHFVAGVLERDPPIVVSVTFEHGLHGSSAAAPLAGKMIEHFYRRHGGRLQVAESETEP